MNIETSTKNCSVSVSKNGKTLVLKELSENEFSHAEKLHLYIIEILSKIDVSLKDLIAIAISKGPGSYTGLRIGVSTAKGFCYALNIPLISVDTLESLVSQINIKNGYIIPMIDARRMEVYCSIFNNNHKKIRETQAQIIDKDSFADINEDIYIIGNCSEKIKTVLDNKKFIFMQEIIFPSANNMSKISFTKFQNNNFEDLVHFEPQYLKDYIIVKK